MFLSDVRIWNTVRTVTQISDNKDARLVGDETGLIHYWKIDEGSGTSIEDLVGTTDGTIVGADWVSDSPPFSFITGTLKEKESGSGSAEHYLIIDPSDGSVLEAGTAESDGSMSVDTIDDTTTEYLRIMPDKDGDYPPVCDNLYVTGE